MVLSSHTSFLERNKDQTSRGVAGRIMPEASEMLKETEEKYVGARPGGVRGRLQPPW
jgi:hypothetical protein